MHVSQITREEVVKFIAEQGGCSLSSLQRRFRVSVTTALDWVRHLELDGVIEPHDEHFYRRYISPEKRVKQG